MVDYRAVFTTNKCNCLQATRAKAESIVCADFGFGFIFRALKQPSPNRALHGEQLGHFLVVRLIGRELCAEVRDRAIVWIPCQRTGNRSGLHIICVVFLAGFDYLASTIGNPFGPRTGTTLGVTLSFQCPA